MQFYQSNDSSDNKSIIGFHTFLMYEIALQVKSDLIKLPRWHLIKITATLMPALLLANMSPERFHNFPERKFATFCFLRATL